MNKKLVVTLLFAGLSNMWALLLVYTLNGSMVSMTDTFSTEQECETMGHEYKSLMYNASEFDWTCTPVKS